MPKYRILLVEELVLSDSGEFQVEAPQPRGRRGDPDQSP